MPMSSPCSKRSSPTPPDSRAISIRAARLLRRGGLLVLEHGELQGAEVRGLLTADGWRAAATTRDLLGRDRATTALK